MTLDAINALDFLICASEQTAEKSKLGSLTCKDQQASGYSQVSTICAVKLDTSLECVVGDYQIIPHYLTTLTS